MFTHHYENKAPIVAGVLSVYCFGLILLAACNASQPVDPASAQRQAQSAWQQAWHGAWELTWPQSPLSGPLTFEAWFTEGGQQTRFEILEAPVPSLIGLVYVNNGASAGYYNRLQPGAVVSSTTQTLPFSPLSQAFQIIDHLLTQPPQSAQLQQAGPSNSPITKITLTYAGEKILNLWLNPQTNLVIRVHLKTPDTELALTARSVEPLGAPHPKLFMIIND
jgi:hypothetical protein